MGNSDCHIRETGPAVLRAGEDPGIRLPPAASVRRKLPGLVWLAAGLLAAAALLAGAGGAQAQTVNPDGSGTVWTATLIVSSDQDGVVDIGYWRFGSGSLAPDSFTWADDYFRVTALGIFDLGGGCGDGLRLFDDVHANWKASEARWVLHIDDDTFDFADADDVSPALMHWCNVTAASLGWAHGDTVDVKITRKAGTPIAVPDGHPVVWLADVVPGSESGREGWSADNPPPYGLLSGPVDFEYKGWTYYATDVYTSGGPLFFELTKGSDDAPPIGDADSNLTLHIGSRAFPVSESFGSNPIWINPNFTWPAVGANVGLSTSEPGPPRELSATTSSDTSVTLGWRAPEKVGGTAITGYEYRRSAGGGANWGSWTEIANSADLTIHLVTGLSADTAYTFQLRAVNQSGSGLHSGIAAAQASVASLTLSDAGRDEAYGIDDAVSVTVTIMFSWNVNAIITTI